jgi:hypothetical protein
LHLADGAKVFPNATVPIAGVLDFWRTHGILTAIGDNTSNDLINGIGILNPFEFSSKDDLKETGVLNKVWKFSNPNHVAWLVDAFKKELSKLDVFERGVLRAFDWCLNEPMDNVFGHSQVGVGFVMGQIHSKNKHVAFTIFDYGIGIYNSLKGTDFARDSVSQAIKNSLQEGVTRDVKTRQGNGLYGLREMVRLNNGRLTVSSSSGRYFYNGIREQLFDGLNYLDNRNGTTTVDFQLDYNNPITLGEILFRGKPYDFLDLKIENMETPQGEIQFELKHNAESFGTRESALALRIQILNLFKETQQAILLDFEEVDIVSSSFADELVGQLVIELGFFGFNNFIKLKNMNGDVQAVVQRSVGQRMAQSFAGKDQGV